MKYSTRLFSRYLPHTLGLSTTLRCLTAGLGLVVACPDFATAEIVSLRSTGIIWNAAVGANWEESTPFEATYSYDTNTAPYYNDFDSLTYYFNTVKSFSISIGSSTFSMPADGFNKTIRIGDNLFATDRFILDAPLAGTAATGYKVASIQIDLYGNPSTWSGVSLPTNAALLQSLADERAGGSSVRLVVLNDEGTSGDTAYGSITTVTAVPEPSTYAMALAGLACGGFSMWRRRNRA